MKEVTALSIGIMVGVIDCLFIIYLIAKVSFLHMLII